MAPDGVVALVIDGSGVQDRLHAAEELFDVQELLVFEGHLGGTQVEVGTEDPEAVEASLRAPDMSM
jgi:hypothetical protein